MHKRLLIADPYLSDRASIYATSEVSGMGASRLLRSSQPKDRWVAPDLTNLAVTIHLQEVSPGHSRPWDLVAPLYTNSGPDSLWQIVASRTEAGLDDGPDLEDDTRAMRPDPNMDGDGEPAWRHALRWFEGEQHDYPWIRMHVNDASPLLPDDYTGAPYAEWGRLYVSLAWQPSYHHDKGSGLTVANEQPRRVRSHAGSTHFGEAPRPRTFQFNVGFLDKAEMRTRGYRLDRVAGASGDVLVVDDPYDADLVHQGMIYGYLAPAPQRHEDWETYSRAYTIEEAL